MLVTLSLLYVAAGSLWWCLVLHPREAERLALVGEAEPLIAFLMVAEAIALWPREVWGEVSGWWARRVA